MLLFLEPLIAAIRAPLEFVRSKIFGVQSTKGKIKIDIDRLKSSGQEYKAALGAGADRVSGGKQKKVRIGMFAKKKKCPSCGEKLHASWDQCPYCNWGKPATQQAVSAPMPSAGGKQRTVAFNMNEVQGAGGVGLSWLVPLEGESVGELFQLKSRCVVGTSPQCDVQLKDQGISGRHAEFTFQGGVFRLNDLGSTNGTFVNDRRVTSTELVDNDIVRLGRTNFKFKAIT
jgi:hypothetical protein